MSQSKSIAFPPPPRRPSPLIPTVRLVKQRSNTWSLETRGNAVTSYLFPYWGDHGANIFVLTLSNSKRMSINLSFISKLYLDRVKRIWYLSPVRAASQKEPSDRKPDPWPLWMAGHSNLSWRNARRHKFAWRGSFIELTVSLFSSCKCMLCMLWTFIFISHIIRKPVVGDG